MFTVGGYVLKYMYTISASNATKFLTTDFMPVETDSTVSAEPTDGAVRILRVTNVGTGLTDGTYYAAIEGDGSNAGTSSGAIARIVISSNQIQAFGTDASTTSGIHAKLTSGYTFGTINLSAGNTFSDATLTTAAAIGGSGGAIDVIISPKGGHGSNAVKELGAHFVIVNTTFSGAESDDILAGNDFRNVGIVVDPTNFVHLTVATASTVRQTYALKFDSVSGTFTPDEKITQASTSAIGKVVEFDSSNNILYYQQERHELILEHHPQVLTLLSVVQML